MEKVSKRSITESILKAIEKAAHDCFVLTGLTIRQSPEYIYNTYIVREICDNFNTIGFRLEMQFKDLFEALDVEPNFPPQIGLGAKFDTVLTSRANCQPCQVIEVKRTSDPGQVIKEAKRIKFVADHCKQRLKTGFIVCLMRTKINGNSAENYILNRVSKIESELGSRYSISEDHREYPRGKFGYPKEEGFFVVVFEIEKL